MENFSENLLKASLGQKKEATKGIKHQTVLWIDSSVDYHTLDKSKDEEYNKYEWPKAVTIKAGFYFPKMSKGDCKCVKNSTPVFRQKFYVPLPRFTGKGKAKEAIDFNSARRTDLLELAFDKTGVDRAAFKDLLDSNYELIYKSGPHSNESNMLDNIQKKFPKEFERRLGKKNKK